VDTAFRSGMRHAACGGMSRNALFYGAMTPAV